MHHERRHRTLLMANHSSFCQLWKSIDRRQRLFSAATPTFEIGSRNGAIDRIRTVPFPQNCLRIGTVAGEPLRKEDLCVRAESVSLDCRKRRVCAAALTQWGHKK